MTLKCLDCANCRVFEPNFCCIGCDGRGDQHETVFETESERVMAGLPAADAYMPLGDSPYLLQQVKEGAQRSEFKGAKGGGRLPAPTQTPEELLESGKIDIVEYRRLIALPPPAAASSQRGGDGGSGALVPTNGETQLLGPGVGPTGREYAVKGSTVKQMSIPIGDGRTMEIATNLGRPMPQPGKDFSRPWEPAPPRRPHPMAGGARKKEPQRPEIEDITPESPRAAATSHATPPAEGGGTNWLSGLGASMSKMFAPGDEREGGDVADYGQAGPSSSRSSARGRGDGPSAPGSSRGAPTSQHSARSGSSQRSGNKPSLAAQDKAQGSGSRANAKERLLELNDLKSAGLITPEEFAAKRAAILGGI